MGMTIIVTRERLDTNFVSSLPKRSNSLNASIMYCHTACYDEAKDAFGMGLAMIRVVRNRDAESCLTGDVSARPGFPGGSPGGRSARPRPTTFEFKESLPLVGRLENNPLFPP